MTPLRVLIADDHAVVRDGLRALLATEPDIAVVGTAADGAEALHVAAETRPQVVVMDLAMPGMDGVEATRRLSSAVHPPAVLVLTMSAGDSALLAAVRAGARGYLLKDSEGQQVIAAVRAVAAGQVVFGRGVAPAVLALLHAPPAQQPYPFPALTQREREVLGLLASGHGNQSIARRLGISPKTVANGVSAVLAKLGVPDRAAAVDLVRAAGVGSTSRSGG
jgi:DNA-binding NarL/FixJ family response regulator